MPRLAANLSMLFHELAMPQRFAAAAAAGFGGAEVLFPYDWPATAMRQWFAEAGLQPVLINTPPGDTAAGERGLAALPGRTADFRAALDAAIDYAGTLGCLRIHVMAGVAPPGPDSAATYRDNLAWAATAAAPAGITLCIEPINQRDVPGYFLRTAAQAREVIEAVGAANLRLQFDIYHAQIIGGDLTCSITNHLDLIEHVQIAGPPERCEPDAGELNMPYLLDLLDRLGYRGWVSLEYRPRAGTLAGLGWARPYGIGG